MIEIGYAGALLGGLLALLSPCSVMLLPSFFAYAFASKRALVMRTLIFYAGLAATLVPMGVLAGAAGAFLVHNRGTVIAVGATVVILFGIVQIAGVPMPSFTRRGGADGTSALSVFLLGTVYGVAGVCAGPILGSVLTIASLGGNPVHGGVLLALYGLGMTAPLFALALMWDKLRIAERGWLRPRIVTIGRWKNTWTSIVSGALCIGIGVLLLLTEGTASLGGVLTVTDQFTAESWAVSASSGIPNFLFAGVAIAILSGTALLFAHRRRRHTRDSAARQDKSATVGTTVA